MTDIVDRGVLPVTRATSMAGFTASKYLSRPSAVAFSLILGLTIVRIWLALSIGLGVDESYASTIARDLNLSYYDDPPLHFWLAHYAVAILGEGRILRIPFVFIGAGSSWLVYLLGCRLFGSRAGLWSLALYSLTPFFTLVSSSWILPDGPLNLLLLAATLQLVTLMEGTGPARPLQSARLYASIGVLIGLAALTKYHAFLFSLGALGFVLMSRRHWPLLRAPGIYAAMAITLLACAPVLLWNAEHHWASFALQEHRATGGSGMHLSHLWSQIGGQLGLLGPWNLVPIGLALVRAWQHRSVERYRLLLLLGLPNVMFFTLVPVFGIKGFPHWTMPGWIILLPLVGDYLANLKRKARKAWLGASVFLCVVILAGAYAEVRSGWLGQLFPSLFPAGDPSVEAIEWSQIAGSQVLSSAVSDGQEIVSTNWRDGGKLAQALGSQGRIIVLPRDPHGFALRYGAAGTVGARVLIVVRNSERQSLMPELRKYFGNLRFAGSSAIGRDGKAEIPLTLLSAVQVRRFDFAF